MCIRDRSSLGDKFISAKLQCNAREFTFLVSASTAIFLGIILPFVGWNFSFTWQNISALSVLMPVSYTHLKWNRSMEYSFQTRWHRYLSSYKQGKYRIFSSDCICQSPRTSKGAQCACQKSPCAWPFSAVQYC